MRKKLLVFVGIFLLCLSNSNAQEKVGGRVCPDVPGQTSATHRFLHLGETIEIPLRGDQSSTDCEPWSFALHWANGRNNGSNFNVTFLDANNKPIFARQISAFLTGVLEFPLSSFDPQPVYGSPLELVSVPAVVRIQSAAPFAAPATLFYSITRVARASNRETGERGDSERGEKRNGQWVKIEAEGNDQSVNQVVSIHDAVRLIGASRLPLVQIELKTSQPFPVSDLPLQLQIGKRVFVEELSGDHTGRKLTLSLTPEMFAELNDGDEITAFIGKLEPSSRGSAAGETRRFGKLRKSMKTELGEQRPETRGHTAQ
jgi:hypothetical protein